ncbi:MAG: hypothetical protein E3J89_01930 [Candidatus Aminicenantes bacterium]|nr:MAG: hypothetical protein E3J89_01930 [Candidatus Aminicenantes bacterium]
MKVKILDENVTVYADMDLNTPALTELVAGNEVELGKTTKKLGVQWVEVILPNGQHSYIPGDTMVEKITGEMFKQSDHMPVSAIATRETATRGMFKDSDYTPFMLGVFIIGGLLVIPFTWGLGVGMGYFATLPWSIGSCIMYLIAFRRNGTISWGRAIPAIVTILIAARVYAQNTGKPTFAAGGILGLIVIIACGYTGIAIGRLGRRREWHTR